MWKLRALALAGLAVGLAGCSKSGPSAKVTGKVLYQGQPVKAGVVYFKSDEHGSYSARLGEDEGTYTFNDLPAGTYTVLVDNKTFDPDQKATDYVKSKGGKKTAAGIGKGLSEYDKTVGGGDKSRGDGDPATGMSKEQREKYTRLFVKLPAKYADAKSSPLKYTVVDGEQAKDFELTD
ncbi:MAG: carboxypeptidase-like regulatory domain-containing protein [Gemmataceae bacterium]|nr:carboxypeptidase-like regulatory domain-containing protein [Gemmataceae bacterium]